MSEHRILAEIPGSVIDVGVTPGASVGVGDVVVLLESMKMEIPVLTEAAGVVVSVAVTPGDAVRDGAVLAVVEPVPVERAAPPGPDRRDN